MLEALFYVAIGAFVGWNLPQPAFAKKIQKMITDFFSTSSSDSK